MANAMVTWNEAKHEDRVFSEKFLSGGNTFGRGHSVQTNNGFEVSANNNFTLKKPFFLDLKTALLYQKICFIRKSGTKSSGKRIYTFL